MSANPGVLGRYDLGYRSNSLRGAGTFTEAKLRGILRGDDPSAQQSSQEQEKPAHSIDSIAMKGVRGMATRLRDQLVANRYSRIVESSQLGVGAGYLAGVSKFWRIKDRKEESTREIARIRYTIGYVLGYGKMAALIIGPFIVAGGIAVHHNRVEIYDSLRTTYRVIEQTLDKLL